MTLIGTALGLLATGVPFAIALFKLFKNKNKNEIFTIIRNTVEAIVKEVESNSDLHGADKKKYATELIAVALKTNGIDIGDYADLVANYIEDCVQFGNTFKK